MQARTFFSGVILVVLVAACGGGSPTQAPAGATTNPDGGGGTPTNGPEATQSGDGGGGGAGDTSHGKAHVDVTGPDVSASKDLGFLALTSHFGGTDATILYFTNGDEIVLTMTWTSGSAAVTYVSPDLSTTGIDCATSNVNIGGSSASGSFDCTSSFMILKSGASVEGGTLKGTFEARG